LSAVIFQVWLPAASATAFNWSSVAARPVVAVPFHVVLDKPPIVLVVPLTVTPPIVAVLPVIAPVLPSIVTALAPVPRVTLSLSFTS